VNRLHGKVAFITGTAGAQGRAAAMAFSAARAVVVGADLDAEGAAETTKLVEATGGTLISTAPVDLSDPDSAARWIDDGVSEVGGIDVLYNNASSARTGSIKTTSLEDWSFVLRNEIGIVFYVTRAAWPVLENRGGGSIINIASVTAVRPSPNWLAHAAAKGGVVSMSQQLAAEGAAAGIRCNVISPGVIDTPRVRLVLGDALHQMRIPLGRMGQAQDIAQCALYLASDESSWVTGAHFIVDGGVSGTAGTGTAPI
jgi:meso-butanediol dehydrogenase / (S,S)-butanediol dehydrogenase / diacetyl reductase